MEGGAAGGEQRGALGGASALLFLDGTDWAATITDAAAAVLGRVLRGGGDGRALYVVRHGAVYYSLGKWVLEWNRQLFDGSDGVSLGVYEAEGSLTQTVTSTYFWQWLFVLLLSHTVYPPLNPDERPPNPL